MSSRHRTTKLLGTPSTASLSASSSSGHPMSPQSAFKPIKSIIISESKTPSPKAASELTKMLAKNTLRQKTPYRKHYSPTLLANELARSAILNNSKRTNVNRKKNRRSISRLRPRRKAPVKSLRMNTTRRNNKRNVKRSLKKLRPRLRAPIKLFTTNLTKKQPLYRRSNDVPIPKSKPIRNLTPTEKYRISKLRQKMKTNTRRH